MRYQAKVYTSNADDVIEEEADFVSLMNTGTYGIPPIHKDRLTEEITVLYINTMSPHLVAFSIESVA